MKKGMLSTTIILAALALLLIPTPGLPQDAIEQRDKLMKSTDKALKAVRAAAKQMDYATLQVRAKEIVDNMGRMLDLFPEGSLSEDSNAHPSIWDKWDEFSKHRDKVREAAENVARAAAAQDDAQILAQVKVIGGMSSGGCGGCHVSFNKKRMKKK